VTDIAELLLAEAQILDGLVPHDPAAFAKWLNGWSNAALGVRKFSRDRQWAGNFVAPSSRARRGV
jgi:hypothetical protein